MPSRPPTHKPFPSLPRKEKPRPKTAARGYGLAWQKFRAYRLGIDPLCHDCGAVAKDVHHRVKKTDGGEDSIENTMSLCHRCHSIRTRRGE